MVSDLIFSYKKQAELNCPRDSVEVRRNEIPETANITGLSSFGKGEQQVPDRFVAGVKDTETSTAAKHEALVNCMCVLCEKSLAALRKARRDVQIVCQ